MDLEEFGDLSSIFGVKQRGDLSRNIGSASDRISQEIASGNRQLLEIERHRNTLIESQQAAEAHERDTRIQSRKALVTLKRGLESLESENVFDQFFQIAFISYHLWQIEENGALESIDDFNAVDELKHNTVSAWDEANFPDIQSIVNSAHAHASEINELMGKLENALNSKRFFDPEFDVKYRNEIKRIKQTREAAKNAKMNSLFAQILIEQEIKSGSGSEIKEHTIEAAENYDFYASELGRIEEETDLELREIMGSIEGTDSSALEAPLKQVSFFDEFNIFDENLSYASKAADLISELEAELRLIDSDANDLIHSQDYLPESFKAFMDAADIELSFDFDENSTLLNLLQRGDVYDAIIKRLNNIREFVEKCSLDNRIEELREKVIKFDFEKAQSQLGDIESDVPNIIDYDKLHEQLVAAQEFFSEIQILADQYRSLKPSFKDRVFKNGMRELIGHYDSKLKNCVDNYPIPEHRTLLERMIAELKSECLPNLEGFDVKVSK